jgi:hypothetical protein
MAGKLPVESHADRLRRWRNVRLAAVGNERRAHSVQPIAALAKLRQCSGRSFAGRKQLRGTDPFAAQDRFGGPFAHRGAQLMNRFRLPLLDFQKGRAVRRICVKADSQLVAILNPVARLPV